VRPEWVNRWQNCVLARLLLLLLLLFYFFIIVVVVVVVIISFVMSVCPSAWNNSVPLDGFL
jgi:hypothetical protein